MICTVDVCEQLAKCRGMCTRHYDNQRRTGTPIPVRELPLRERLERVGWDVTASGCWEWRGNRNSLGYGRLTAPVHGADHARVHRLMYELHIGPIPDGLVVRHRCDNPPCVNPAHLEVGTRADNAADMAERGRRRRATCPAGHDRTLPGMVAGKDRHCVLCNRERQRRWIERRRRARSAGAATALKETA